MDEVLAACIGLAGVIVGVLLTWISGYFLKLQEAKIQREHTKFTYFHSKQIEVLSEVYKQLSLIISSIDSLMIVLPEKNDLSPESWNNYRSSTSEDFQTLIKVYDEYQAYRRINAVFLDDEFELELVKASRSISKLLMIRSMNHDTWHRLKPFDKPSLFFEAMKLANTEIRKMMTEIKSRVKHIISG